MSKANVIGAVFLFASVGATSVAAAQSADIGQNEEFSKQPATKTQAALCPDSSDARSNFIFWGTSGIEERPLDFLMCATHEGPQIWRMSCDMAQAFSGIFGKPSPRPDSEFESLKGELHQNTQEAIASCRGLLLS